MTMDGFQFQEMPQETQHAGAMRPPPKDRAAFPARRPESAVEQARFKIGTQGERRHVPGR